MEPITTPRNQTPGQRLVWLRSTRAMLVAEMKSASASQGRRACIAKTLLRIEAQIAAMEHGRDHDLIPARRPLAS